MLPSNLLIARRWREGIRPRFASINSDNISLVNEVLAAYKRNLGKKQQAIHDELLGLEDLAWDHRFIRGVAVLIERKCSFAVGTSLDPVEVRRRVFAATGTEVPTDAKKRELVLARAASELGADAEDVEAALYADLDAEKVLEKFGDFDAVELIKRFNLGQAQALLFYCGEISFVASGNWQNIFRNIKRGGLIYSVSRQPTGFMVKADGPISLFKLSRRYGVALAAVLPEIMKGRPWSFTAKILQKRTNLILDFQLDSEKHGWLFPSVPAEEGFDSSVEADFAARFEAMESEWAIKREAEPLITGNSVLLPDFMFSLGETKVYMEIVGFWTKEYLKRKLEKLAEIRGVPFILAVDRTLACEKIDQMQDFHVLYYRQKVPLEPVLKVLRGFEEKHVGTQSASFEVQISEPFITVEQLAKKSGLLREAIIRNKDKITTHVLAGETFIRPEILEEARRRLLEFIGENQVTLEDALLVLRDSNFPDPVSVISACGYRVKWRGLTEKDAFVYPSKKV